MRTTIRLPDDLYQRVRVTAAQEGQTVTAFLEEALRAALDHRRSGAPRPLYQVKPTGAGGLRPGVNLDDSSALLDLMDDDARA